MHAHSLAALGALELQGKDSVAMDEAVERIFGFIDTIKHEDFSSFVRDRAVAPWQLRDDVPAPQDAVTVQALRAGAHARENGLIPVSALRASD